LFRRPRRTSDCRHGTAAISPSGPEHVGEIAFFRDRHAGRLDLQEGEMETMHRRCAGLERGSRPPFAESKDMSKITLAVASDIALDKLGAPMR